MFTNLEFPINDAIVFHENELSGKSKQIHERALQRAERYLVAEADLLESIIEIDRDRTYENFGLTHLTPYCVKYLGLSEEVAATFVRVARKSLQVPELKSAIDEGRLSVTKAKTIAAVVNSENQKLWIERASTLSKDKLEKEISKISPKSPQPEKAKSKGIDRVRVEFELSDQEMSLFRRAQDLVSRKLRKSASLAETQAELLKCFIDKHDPLERAKRAVKRKGNEKSQEVKNCDRSQEHSEKHRRTSLKAELIHAVNLRDQGQCQARQPDGSLCRQTRWLHFHHIVPIANGGANSIENIITLCGSHHRLWHSEN